jgi:hypothetical protein
MAAFILQFLLAKIASFFVFYLHDQLTIWLSSKFGVETCSDFFGVLEKSSLRRSVFYVKNWKI